jgi:hypothetical protein
MRYEKGGTAMKIAAQHHSRRFWALAAALFALLALALPAPATAQPLQPERFEESLNPEVKVSGATRGGVLLDALESPESLEAIVVRVPESFATGRICLDLVSRDGRYEASLELSLPAERDNFIEIAYPTRFREELTGSEQPYLAALASLRGDCQGEVSAFLPATWGSASEPDRIDVLINAGHNDARIVVPTDSGSRRAFPCRRLEAQPTIAFDRVCTVELAPDLVGLDAVIERDDFFNPLPPVALPLAL